MPASDGLGFRQSGYLHHAVALDRAGKQLFSKPLPQDEAKLRALIGGYQQTGTVLLVVDQPATIGALPVTWPRTAARWSGICPGRLL